MKKNKVTQKEILFISISMFFVVFCWVGFGLYNAWVRSTISKDLQLQIVPIAPKFDTQVLKDLKSREKIEPVSGAIEQVTTTPAPEENSLTSEEEISPISEEVIFPTEEPLPTEEVIPTEIPSP